MTRGERRFRGGIMQRKNRQPKTGRFFCQTLSGRNHCSAQITRVLRAIIRIKILDRALNQAVAFFTA